MRADSFLTEASRGKSLPQRSSLMRLSLAGVGPQKTGTTWLDQCLRPHPQLCLPHRVKETFFFDRHFDKGWLWYWSHFCHRVDGQLCGEIGSSYFDVPDAAKRLHEHNPDCRIIVTLRDPVARSFSLYLHHRKKGRLRCDFREAIRRVPGITEGSRYRIHLARWLELFRPDRILVLLLEDIASAPEQVLERVCRFVGIPPLFPVPTAREPVYTASLPSSRTLAWLATHTADRLRARRLHALVTLAKRIGLGRVYTGSQGKLPAPDPELRGELAREFEPDIAYVEDLLSRPLTHWRAFP